MMSQSSGRGRVVGDYLVGRQIGSGSFSVVWHARHRVHGTEVAIKEIIISRLNKKLQESLMSEIFILKRINHPNIIRLNDIIEVPGSILIVLEYCKGGDLSMYIQRHERVPEAIAKRFMQQLASGLQILRNNNLIHRDLKPQNLLLSTNESNAILKIADFGFARSLQPKGLAETLCGSPLYMAPEIMQLQKYDAKADLWSVGAILFQLVTGKTPFTGNNQIQLLQNILKSTELQFPLDNQDLTAECKDLCQKLLRCNPVERLTFEEFFNHPFLSQRKVEESLRNRRPSRSVDGFPLSENNAIIDTEDNSQEDFLPFVLDDDCSGPERSPSFSKNSSFAKSTSGILLGSRAEGRKATSNVLNNMDFTSRYSPARCNLDNANYRPTVNKSSNENLTELPKSMDQRSVNAPSRAVETLELIDQDYVLVSGPSSDVSTASASTLKPIHLPRRSESSLRACVYANSAPSGPVPIIGGLVSNVCHTSSLESPSSAPGTSQGSMDMGYDAEQPSTDCMTRIKSLQQCASAIAELVHERIEADKRLEAFSIQLIVLAIWKQALHICHAQAASAVKGSPNQESTMLKRSSSKKHGSPDTESCPDVTEPMNISVQIERDFMREVAHADELAKGIEPGSTMMPDAMESIYQSALDLGKHGGAEELLRNNDSAVQLYTKAVCLFSFLLLEAPSLIVNPPLSLTNSTRYRLRTYINAINGRRQYLWSQKIAFHKRGDQHCSPP